MLAALFIMGISCSIFWHEAISVRMEPDRYNKAIVDAAKKYGVDSRLIRAVIYTESKFDPTAVGGAGEIGLMQILPKGAVADFIRINKTHEFTVQELFRPEVNIDIGTWYLAQGLQKYAKHENCIELALCRYNAGDSRARRWAEGEGELADRIDIDSTKNYVQKIMDRYELYKSE